MGDYAPNGATHSKYKGLPGPQPAHASPPPTSRSWVGVMRRYPSDERLEWASMSTPNAYQNAVYHAGAMKLPLKIS